MRKHSASTCKTVATCLQPPHTWCRASGKGLLDALLPRGRRWWRGRWAVPLQRRQHRPSGPTMPVRTRVVSPWLPVGTWPPSTGPATRRERGAASRPCPGRGRPISGRCGGLQCSREPGPDLLLPTNRWCIRDGTEGAGPGGAARPARSTSLSIGTAAGGVGSCTVLRVGVRTEGGVNLGSLVARSVEVRVSSGGGCGAARRRGTCGSEYHVYVVHPNAQLMARRHRLCGDDRHKEGPAVGTVAGGVSDVALSGMACGRGHANAVSAGHGDECRRQCRGTTSVRNGCRSRSF